MGIFGRRTGKSGRPVPVDYHIYKNAGTSVDRNLSASFGDRWAPFEGNGQQFVLSNTDVAAFAQANPHVCAISSHKARPFPAVETFVPILFLRHPVERARSMYHFARRDPNHVDHAVARDGSFTDYVEWSLSTQSALAQLPGRRICPRPRFASPTSGARRP